jgi:hypothetical protein
MNNLPKALGRFPGPAIAPLLFCVAVLGIAGCALHPPAGREAVADPVQLLCGESMPFSAQADIQVSGIGAQLNASMGIFCTGPNRMTMEIFGPFGAPMASLEMRDSVGIVTMGDSRTIIRGDTGLTGFPGIPNISCRFADLIRIMCGGLPESIRTQAKPDTVLREGSHRIFVYQSGQLAIRGLDSCQAVLVSPLRGAEKWELRLSRIVNHRARLIELTDGTGVKVHISLASVKPMPQGKR